MNQIAALQAQYNQLVNQAAEFELQATLLYHEYKDPKSLGYQSIATYELYILAKQWRNQSVSQAKAIASQITNLQKWGAFLDGAATAGRACLCVPAEVVGAVAGLVFPVWQDPTQYGPGHVY